MTSFEEWCRAVEKSPVGEIALSNMRYDATHDRVGRVTRAAFRERLVAIHTARPAVRPVGIIQRVTHEQPDDYFCRGKELPFEQCSRVVPDLDFVHENINLDDRGWLVEDFVPDEYLDELEISLTGLAKDTIPANPKKHFAWVTRTEALDHMRATIPEELLASAVRNKCGLLHHGASDQLRLIEIRYPPEGIARTLHIPTFLEGAPYGVYMSKSELRAAAPCWGTSLDITGVADGLPEAVHRRIDFTDKFTVKRLGAEVDGVVVNVTWPKVLKRIPLRWESDYAELEGLFT